MVPRTIRLLFGVGISALLVSAHPQAMLHDANLAGVVTAAAHEVLLGIMLVLVLQLPFAAFNFVGRTIDIQAGYGIALLIDPTTRSQVPLVGMLLSLLGGAAFFAVDGHLALLRLLSASLAIVPLGQWSMPDSIAPLTQFMSLLFLMGFGVAGAVMLALFLADLMIAMLSRTVPQMNVLVLGFQVKSIILLAALPLAFGMGSAILLRMTTMALDQLPRLV